MLVFVCVDVGDVCLRMIGWIEGVVELFFCEFVC